MSLPLRPPVAPQLARSQRALPSGDGWAYEPKWDGFRAVVFVEDGERYLQSRSARDLGRYFPEVAPAGGRFVLDAEIVLLDADGRPDFEALQQRLHPAASRVQRLAQETPARYIAFDLLAQDDQSLLEAPFAARRALLEALLQDGRVALTPATRARDQAEPWLRSGEGVVAKDVEAAYHPGQRTGMVKVKRVRTIDAVVAGYRPGKEPGTVGSLILGLYDQSGELHIVGHSSGLRAAEKRALVQKLAPYETGKRGHGDPSRWKSEKELEWIELRPELVVEVTFDHVSGGRIRHGTRILQWREDKAPRECLLEQMSS
jgi:ATP-dependent DNA ligase